MKPVVFGDPGSHARGLATRAALRSVGFAALCAALVVASWRLGVAELLSATRPVSAFVAAGLLVPAAFAAREASVSWRSMRRAEIGWRSERRVARVLERTSSVAVLHGALLGAGGDADHVVLGPGVIVVETKTGAGRVRVDGAAMFAGARRIPKSPVEQVLRQAKALGRATGTQATAVVCVPDMSNKAFEVGGVTVCSLRDLDRVVRSAPRRLDAAHAVDSARRIHEGAALRSTGRHRR